MPSPSSAAAAPLLPARKQQRQRMRAGTNALSEEQVPREIPAAPCALPPISSGSNSPHSQSPVAVRSADCSPLNHVQSTRSFNVLTVDEPVELFAQVPLEIPAAPDALPPVSSGSNSPQSQSPVAISAADRSQINRVLSAWTSNVLSADEPPSDVLTVDVPAQLLNEIPAAPCALPRVSSGGSSPHPQSPVTVSAADRSPSNRVLSAGTSNVLSVDEPADCVLPLGPSDVLTVDVNEPLADSPF